MVVANKHMCVLLLLCLMKKNHISVTGKEACKTGIVPFALKELKCVIVLMFSSPKCHNCAAITKVSGVCLVVHGFMIQHQINYQLASVKRDSLYYPLPAPHPSCDFCGIS